MAKRYLTLNIGAANIELAEYEAGAKGALTLVNYGTAPLAAPLDGGDAGAILTPAIQEVVRTKGIRPGKIALAISGQMVFPRFAAIPMAGGAEKFEQMVRYEIEQNIPFPIDEIVCDRQVLGDTETGDKSVMIVAAKVDQVEALTTAVAAAGFTPELVDAAPLALTNALRHAIGDDGSCSVLLDIGSKTTSLVIVEGDKIYNRSIPVAGNAVTKEIAAALGCTTEEAEQLKREKGYVSMGGVTEDDDEVADRISKACRAVMTRLNAEISRSINFYRSQQGGTAPTRLYLTGGTALLPQIDVFFQESLQIEVVFFNPFEALAVGAHRRHGGPRPARGGRGALRDQPAAAVACRGAGREGQDPVRHRGRRDARRGARLRDAGDRPSGGGRRRATRCRAGAGRDADGVRPQGPGGDGEVRGRRGRGRVAAQAARRARGRRAARQRGARLPTARHVDRALGRRAPDGALLERPREGPGRQDAGRACRRQAQGAALH